MVFKDLMTDIVTLEKANGTVITDIKANVQTELIFIEDGTLPIEEGDKIIRTFPNKLVERYLVIDRGFHEAFVDLDAHYQVKVRKETKLPKEEKAASVQFNIQTAYGSIFSTHGSATMTNTFNFDAVDQMIDEHGGEDKEELKQMMNEIKDLLEDSNKISKGALVRFSEKIEKHSWIAGSIAQAVFGYVMNK
ncbi:hypothetical protein P9G84_10170 [Brevibacillus centrosporus]|uniref:hypothetical protein n=1 Tax=Brevibacillus centrosporus TaxID=54910 RepID=UPI0011430819|nr:hypothetical protein [Brevibacillus centrosporus]MEC2129333.1 hypothetical protein [Brevibacillus centrosporus]GED33499.1 hypothetical protein BCE02nite_46400 [Brevibacillus centrosporus]